MKVGTLEINMPFLCRLGWHKPKPVAHWNCGYYFTTCARCDRDLVRTAYGRWHMPHGYRVVWQVQPPANAVAAGLVRGRTADSPADGAELPIQEVLRHIQNGTPAVEEQAAGPGVAGENPEVDGPYDTLGADRTEEEGDPGSEATRTEQDRLITTVPARRIPDFMDESASPSAWETPARVYLRRPAPAGRDRSGDFEAEDRGPGPFRRLGTRLMSLFERARSARAEPSDDRDASAGVAPGWRLAMILAIPIIAVLLVLVLKDVSEDGRVGGTNESVAEGAQISPSAGQPAFVTASLLNCRSAPAREAESLEILMRGDVVRLLARDGDWVSLVRRGGQCWALVRYFSLDRPI